MRDLKIEEVGQVYGAGGGGCEPLSCGGYEPEPKGSKAKGSKAKGSKAKGSGYGYGCP